jgi:hypothetical protein
MKLKNALLILAIAAAPVFAMDAQPSNLSKTVPLKGGETLYVFKDGRMAKANQFGRPVFLKQGEILTPIDGQPIAAVGNEIAQLSGLIRQGHEN